MKDHLGAERCSKSMMTPADTNVCEALEISPDALRRRLGHLITVAGADSFTPLTPLPLHEVALLKI